MKTIFVHKPAILNLTSLGSPNPDMEQYVPGVCNIGKKEIERRKHAAFFSFIFSIICITLIQWLNANREWRLLLFIPAASLGVSFQQWYFKFCVAFGIKGIFNFGNIGESFTIDQKECFKKDRVKAWRMILFGVLFGVFCTLIYYFLPI